MNQSKIQESQYGFPYHHVPALAPDGAPRLSRRLAWGFEYLGYIGEVRRIVAGLKPTRVLEVGCGDGRVLLELADIVPERVGCDRSAAAIRFARAFDPTARYVCGEASELEDTPFDLVMAIETLEHIPLAEVPLFLRTLWMLVPDGGYLLLSVPSDLRPLHPKHFQHFSTTALQAAVQLAAPSAQAVHLEEVCAESACIRLWQYFCMNRRWWIEIGYLNRLLWSHYQRRCIRPAARRGTHVLGLFRKS